MLQEKKMKYMAYYQEALETSNYNRANFLRGKLTMLDELIKELKP